MSAGNRPKRSFLDGLATAALREILDTLWRDQPISFPFFWNFFVAIESDDAHARSVGPTYQYLCKGTNMSKTKTPSPTTPKVASRVQRANALTSSGTVKSGSVVGRMQRAAVKNFGKPGSK